MDVMAVVLLYLVFLINSLIYQTIMEDLLPVFSINARAELGVVSGVFTPYFSCV